jgi:hypothetical protein
MSKRLYQRMKRRHANGGLEGNRNITREVRDIPDIKDPCPSCPYAGKKQDDRCFVPVAERITSCLFFKGEK